MGNSSSSDDKKQVENAVPSDEVEKEQVKEDTDDLDLSDPIQNLLYLLRKDNVNEAEVRALLSNENDKIELNVPDLPPAIDPNADQNDPHVKKMLERIAKKTYLGDYPMHVLVGRPPSKNTPELLDLVKLFFLKDHQMNCRNRLGSTPLHRACAAGNAGMARELIRWGSQVDAVNDMQLSCLHMACLSGSAETVKLLLDNGCAKHITFKCLYGIAPVDYVLKDDVMDLIRAARKANVSASSPLGSSAISGAGVGSSLAGLSTMHHEPAIAEGIEEGDE